MVKRERGGEAGKSVCIRACVSHGGTGSSCDVRAIMTQVLWVKLPMMHHVGPLCLVLWFTYRLLQALVKRIVSLVAGAHQLCIWVLSQDVQTEKQKGRK